MSFFQRFFQASAAPATLRSGIRSATGLPRAVIAAHYRSAGLFGRDSDLSGAEQIVVWRRLGSLPGVPEVPTPAWAAAKLGTPRLRLLAEYVDALIAGRGAQDKATSLRLEGFGAAAISEVERTVLNVEDIFGPRSLPTTSDVRVSTVAAPAYDQAA